MCRLQSQMENLQMRLQHMRPCLKAFSVRGLSPHSKQHLSRSLYLVFARDDLVFRVASCAASGAGQPWFLSSSYRTGTED